MDSYAASSYECDCGNSMKFDSQSRCDTCGRDVDLRKVKKLPKPQKLQQGSLKTIGMIPDTSVTAPAAPAAGGPVAMGKSEV